MLNGHHHALNGSSHHDASHRLRREAKRALKKTGFTSRQILCFLGVVVTVIQMVFAAKWLTSGAAGDDEDLGDSTIDYSAADVDYNLMNTGKLTPTRRIGDL